MKTTTWINASALLAAVTLTLGIATWDATAPGALILPAAPARTAFTAEVSTDWLPAAAARSEIEQRSALVERFAADHDIVVRVLDSNAELQTRAGSERLEAPLARFTRSFEFSVGDARDADLLRGTLATWSVDLERAQVANAAVH